MQEQQSFQQDAKRVQETVAKQQQSLQEDAERVQETEAKSHSVSSSLLAWQECAQEKLAVGVSSKQRRLARQLAVVEAPTSAALRTVSLATPCRGLTQLSAGARQAVAFPPVETAEVLHRRHLLQAVCR